MSFSIPRFLLFCLCVVLPGMTTGQTMVLEGDMETHASLSNQTITLRGHSELHLTASGDPLPGCTIHLESEDGWVFFQRVLPSAVVSNLLPRFRVNGAQAVVDSNVRVVQYVNGSVVIPQPPGYLPLTVHSGRHFTGASARLAQYTAYNRSALGVFSDNIRSFRLKRGYTATFAANENGTGTSRNFVAQDSDLELSVMPAGLDGTVRFIRVFPWRWVSKKGSCDVSASSLNARWHYNWSISMDSARDWEYVAIKQQPQWPSLSQDWRARGINHLLGFNEPDNPVEHAYQNLTPVGSVSNAVSRWDELLATGLRVGAPAVTDGGFNWIRDFMSQANAGSKRVDYVPIHYYRSFANNNDPAGAANQLYQFLRSIYDMAQRPIWVTEFNNGANWTNDAHDPTAQQNRNVIQAMIQMMDATPWIERYAVYSRVEWFRQTHYDDGSITPMGQMYRDHNAPMAHVQVIPNTGVSGNAFYPFDAHLRDIASGNNPLKYGTPKFVPGRQGNALSFDGVDDYLALPGRIGDSSDFSFAAWVRWDGGANWQRVFDLGSGTDNYLYLTPKSGDNTLRFGIRVGSTQQTINAPALTPGAWTHVAVTLTGNTGRLFVNGSLAATNNSVTLRPHQVNSETNFLGKSQWSTDPLFQGQLDDVRFFNSGLASADVTALAASVAPGVVAEPDLPDAQVGQPWQAHLAPFVSGGSGGVLFEKTSGPAWVSLASDGALGGVPALEDAGSATLGVRISSADGWTSFETVFPMVVLAGDPLARWDFDGSPAATLGPAAATLLNGTGYAPGQTGQALSLTGGTAHAVLPAGIANSEEITLACWVRWDGGSQWQRVFDFGNGTGSYLFLTPRSSANTLRFGIRNGGSEQIVETTQLPTGTWTHLAVTLGNGTGRLYVNGSLAATNAAMTHRPADIRPAANYLGRSQWSSDPYFTGRIDQFQILPRVLDAAAIHALQTATPPTLASPAPALPPASPGQAYVASVSGHASFFAGTPVYSKMSGPAWLVVEADGRISGTPGPADTGVNTFRIRAALAGQPLRARDFPVEINVASPPDLRAHYEFRGNGNDFTSAARHASAQGTPGYQLAWLDSAATFDGVDDHFTLPASALANLTAATFAVRFRWDGGGSWQRLFDFGNNTTQYLFLTPSSGSGTMRFSITMGGNAGQQFIETAAPRTGEWTHAAVTLDGSNATIYVNGIAAASGPVTLTPATIAPTINYLGRSLWPDPYLRGAIDDFRIYSRVLAAEEILSLARPPAGNSIPIPPVADYAAWAAGLELPPAHSGPAADADGDGIANVLEWLQGGNPLDAASAPMPWPVRLDPAESGAPDGKTRLALRARILKNRPGITLRPEAAATPMAFGTSEAYANVQAAGPPVEDGDYEIHTWFALPAIEDAPAGFMRLGVIVE